MALNIKNSATVVLASELARRQGVSKTAAIHQVFSDRLHRLGYSDRSEELKLVELRATRARIARSPERNSRSDEEIIGYDGHGIPG